MTNTIAPLAVKWRVLLVTALIALTALMGTVASGTQVAGVPAKSSWSKSVAAVVFPAPYRR